MHNIDSPLTGNMRDESPSGTTGSKHRAFDSRPGRLCLGPRIAW